MRAIIFAVTLALAMLAVWTPSPARAYEMPYDPYRWCAVYSGDDGGGGTNCEFLTIEPCRATVSIGVRRAQPVLQSGAAGYAPPASAATLTSGSRAFDMCQSRLRAPDELIWRVVCCWLLHTTKGELGCALEPSCSRHSYCG